MNGLDALKALKEGHTVAHFRGVGHVADRQYRYCARDTNNTGVKKIFFRWVGEWVWFEASESVYFWMVADDDAFEVVE